MEDDDSVLEEIKERCRRDFEKNLNYFLGCYKKNKTELNERIRKLKTEQAEFDDETKTIDKKLRQLQKEINKLTERKGSIEAEKAEKSIKIEEAETEMAELERKLKTLSFTGKLGASIDSPRSSSSSDNNGQKKHIL